MTTTAEGLAAKAGPALHEPPKRAGKPFWRRTYGDLRIALFFITPALIGFIAFFLIPTVRGIYLSFTEYSILGEPSWIGIQNYTTILGDELFADPAWDMLLELYASHLGRHIVSTSELVAASAVPATTALRWIDKLDSVGLARRIADPDDRRRVLVQLSGEGLAKMRSYFAAVRSGSSPS